MLKKHLIFGTKNELKQQNNYILTEAAAFYSQNVFPLKLCGQKLSKHLQMFSVTPGVALKQAWIDTLTLFFPELHIFSGMLTNSFLTESCGFLSKAHRCVLAGMLANINVFIV